MIIQIIIFFGLSLKLSLVISSIKVGSCPTLVQERFCLEIKKKLVCLRAVSDCIASDQVGLQQQGTQEFPRD